MEDATGWSLFFHVLGVGGITTVLVLVGYAVGVGISKL